MTATERDILVQQYLSEVIEGASHLNEEDFHTLENYSFINDLLDILIPVKVDGFRGIVMTAIVGKYLDKEYDPLNNFYACNPRSIYEKGIYYVLEKFDIPSAKSAPLNVAKAISKLDDDWVKGRKTTTQPIAKAAIDFIELIMANFGSTNYNRLVAFFFYRLYIFAKRINSLTIVTTHPSTISKNELSAKLGYFVQSIPEAGTIPQTIIGKLLKILHDSEIRQVKGESESVFGTNTTSKKPADIWIENLASEVISLYEITVKKIDYKRLDDCIDSLNKIGNIQKKEVIFICRMPTDVKELKLNSNVNALFHKGYWFNFIDINYFIQICITLLDDQQIDTFFSEMKVFISDRNRPLKTKEGWNELFSK